MADGNLSYGSFISSIFESVTLNRVDFSRANLRFCQFTKVSMIDCLMFGTIFNQTMFSYANLTGCKGLNLTDEQINFHQTILPNGTFIEGSRG